MCRKIKITLAALTAGVCLTALASVPVSAQVLRSGAAAFANRDASVEQVQYRRRYYRGYRRDFDPGAAMALGIIGAAAGMIANNALAPAPYVVGDPNWVAYCSSRYRSFDPVSGTYLGFDGLRHYCQ
jgi:BA14K-like protein